MATKHEHPELIGHRHACLDAIVTMLGRICEKFGLEPETVDSLNLSYQDDLSAFLQMQVDAIPKNL